MPRIHTALAALYTSPSFPLGLLLVALRDPSQPNCVVGRAPRECPLVLLLRRFVLPLSTRAPSGELLLHRLVLTRCPELHASAGTARPSAFDSLAQACAPRGSARASRPWARSPLDSARARLEVVRAPWPLAYIRISLSRFHRRGA